MRLRLHTCGLKALQAARSHPPSPALLTAARPQLAAPWIHRLPRSPVDSQVAMGVCPARQRQRRWRWSFCHWGGRWWVWGAPEDNEDEVTDSSCWVWHSERHGDFGWWRWVDTSRMPLGAGDGGWMWRSTMPQPGDNLAFGEFMVALADRLDPAKPSGHSVHSKPGDELYWWKWNASTGSEGAGPGRWLRGCIAHGAYHWAAAR